MQQITRTHNSSLVNGTSFHGDTIQITPNALISLFGEPDQGDGYKVQTEWILQVNDITFTLYDWKEYENFSYDKPIEYHIGTHTVEESNTAYNALIGYILDKAYIKKQK